MAAIAAAFIVPMQPKGAVGDPAIRLECDELGRWSDACPVRGHALSDNRMASQA